MEVLSKPYQAADGGWKLPHLGEDTITLCCLRSSFMRKPFVGQPSVIMAIQMIFLIRW